MHIKPDCLPCVTRMAVSTMRKLGLAEDTAKELYARIAEIPSLTGKIWDITSPEVIEDVMKIIVSAMGDPDPFREIKAKQNETIMKIDSYVRGLVKASSDHLFLAVKLAAVGNTIDFMMADNPIDIENSMASKLEAPISEEIYSRFKRRLKKSKLLLYVGDNCGEIILDKVLIDTIREEHDPEIVFVVKSVPTMNDATLYEAKSVGMDKMVRVVENGMDGPVPGMILRRCSAEVNELAREADLIISKGGGNFDCLDEESEDIKKKIFFMFLSKCQPYNELFGVKSFQPVLANFA
jgi:uncharacterized protein with ATP-grasp and redox domains